jgi:hypothetical protein
MSKREVDEKEKRRRKRSLLNASHVKWRHLKSDLKAPMSKDEHP